MEEYLSREEEIIVRNWLKTGQKLQPTLDEWEPSVQSAADKIKAVQVWNWGIAYSPKNGNWLL